MDSAERLALIGLAKIKSHQCRVQKALNLIEKTLIPGQSHVAFSAGKDSTVVLDLCRRVNPDIPALFCSTEQKNYMDNYEEVVTDWRQRGASVQETMLTPYNWAPNLSIKEILNAPEQDACFLGLRKSESKARRISLRKYGLFHEYKGGGSRVCPIADWTDYDIWAYIASRNLPYLSFYDTVQKFTTRSRTSIFLGTGHDNTVIAVESRLYASIHSIHFYKWEYYNQDVVRLMRCYWELTEANVAGEECFAYLRAEGFPVSPARIEQFQSFRDTGYTLFSQAKRQEPYLSMAAWVLFKQIYQVDSNETSDQIIDQLRPQ